jgi:hypothetical protein
MPKTAKSTIIVSLVTLSAWEFGLKPVLSRIFKKETENA